MGALDGRVVLVTGASSGLGEATAKMVAAQGARAVLAARREDKGMAVERAIKDAGGNALFVQTDITERDQVESLIDRIMQTFGRLD